MKEQLLFEEVLAYFSVHDFDATKKLSVFWHEDCILHRTPRWHLEKPQRLVVVIEAIRMLQQRYPAAIDIHENDGSDGARQ
jgi:hypothetical protein